MIQRWLKDQLVAAYPGVIFAADYEPDANQSGTVFYEGGGAPARFDAKFRYPRYMIWIESDDWGMAEYLAQSIFETLHELHLKTGPQLVEVEYRDRSGEIIATEQVYLHRIVADGGPNRIGVDGEKMQYSINFDTTITNQKEETTDEEI